jgi:hypothetical protein
MEYYSRVSTLPDHFVILDNGAYEDSNIDPIAILSVANAIVPDEVVLPDVLGDLYWTLYLTSQALGEWPRELNPSIHFMGVPQGKDLKEWRGCCRTMIEMGVHTIGVAIRYEAWPGGRSTLIDMIRGFSTDIDIHLLGWDGDLIKLSHYAQRGDIRGIDTAKPIYYAAAGQNLIRVNGSRPTRPKDYFDLTEANIEPFLTGYNVGILERAAEGRFSDSDEI